jgi:hypothetical protein
MTQTCLCQAALPKRWQNQHERHIMIHDSANNKVVDEKARYSLQKSTMS